MPEPTQTPQGYQILPISSLRESKKNPRKHFDEDKLSDLAISIGQHGILTPLLARPCGADAFELAAGHRRFRAAKIAKLTDVPVVVREMTDPQFLEILTIENLQREDIHPLEEAEGFAGLLAQPGYTQATIAEKIGKSESYVAKRLALLNLSDAFQKAFYQGRINIGHAILLARLQPEDQAELDSVGNGGLRSGLWYRRWNPTRGKDEVEARPPGELDDLIRRSILLNLSAATWKHNDDTLPGGACTACGKRTKANLALFDDIDKGDRCLDRKCFELKRREQLVRIEQQMKEKGLEVQRIVVGHCDPKQLKQLRATEVYEYEIEKKPTSETVRALVVHGPRAGEFVHVRKRASGGPGHGGKPNLGEEAKERRERFEKKVQWEARKLAWKQAVGQVAGLSPIITSFLVRSFARGIVNRDLLAAAGIKCEKGEDPASAALEWAAAPERNSIELARFLVGMALHDLLGEYCNLTGEYGNKLLKEGLDLQGVNLKACVEEVRPALFDKFKASEDRRKASATKQKKKGPKAATAKAKGRSSKMAAASDDEEDNE